MNDKRTFITAIVVAILLGLAWRTFVQPEYLRIDREAAALQATHDRVRILEAEATASGAISDYESDLEVARAVLLELPSQLAADARQVDELSTLCRSVGLELRRVKPGEAILGEAVGNLPAVASRSFQLEVIGEMHQIYAYVDRVQRAPFYASVQSLRFRPAASSGRWVANLDLTCLSKAPVGPEEGKEGA